MTTQSSGPGERSRGRHLTDAEGERPVNRRASLPDTPPGVRQRAVAVEPDPLEGLSRVTRDRIREGIPDKDLRGRGQRAVFGGLVATALGARNAGWTEKQWAAMVRYPQHNLGAQVRYPDGRDGKPRTSREIDKALRDAWHKAQERPAMWGREEARERALNNAKHARALAGDADANLRDADRAVLAYIADQTERRERVDVTAPWRDISAATGYTNRRTIGAAIERLLAAGHLDRIDRGRPGTGAGARAAVYRLRQVPHIPTENRSVGHLEMPKSCGAPSDPKSCGAPPETPTAPTPTPPARKDPPRMEKHADDRIVITGSPHAIAEAMRLLATSGLVEQHPSTSRTDVPDDGPGGVVRHLRRDKEA